MRTLLLFPLLLGCPDVDDDSAASDDDDSTDPCPAEGSAGTGGTAGSSWLTVPGWSTPETDMPDREVLVHAPPSSGATPLPLLVMMTKPAPQDRALVEQIFFEFLDQDGWSDDAGFLLAVPMPGPYEASTIGWYLGLPEDDLWFEAALDAVEARWNVDRRRVFLYGTSAGGRLAAWYGQAHGARITGVADHAGSSPWNQAPDLPWPRAVPGLFIHDEADPIVSRQAMEALVTVWEDAGAPAETVFDYASGHEWVGEEIHPIISEWVGRMCL